MTRQTSIEAYNEIKENGLLSERRWQVYDIVFNHGPMTSAEAFKILNQHSPIKNITQSRARFTELREMGLFFEKSERLCKVTNHKAIEWEVTDRLPIKFEKSKKRKCKHCNGKGFYEEKQTKLF